MEIIRYVSEIDMDEYYHKGASIGELVKRGSSEIMIDPIRNSYVYDKTIEIKIIIPD